MTNKKAKITNDAGPLWNPAGTKLAEDVPHYQDEDGKPNWNKMLTAAHELGHTAINADNLTQVIQELRDRVDAPDVKPPTVEAEPVPVDDGALTDACTQLPEAPVVAFSDFISPNGLRWCVTVRAGLPPDLARQAVAQTINLAKTVEGSALKAGWDAPGNGRKVATSPPPPVTQATPPVAQGNGNGDLTFAAETLVANVNEGNTYWKVKGGRWNQYGVTIWPEVLAAAGLEPDGLDPTQPYDLSGYTAQYTLNDKGKPQKITALVR